MSNSNRKIKYRGATIQMRDPSKWPFSGSLGARLSATLGSRIKFLFSGRMDVRTHFYTNKMVKVGPAETQVMILFPIWVERLYDWIVARFGPEKPPDGDGEPLAPVVDLSKRKQSA